MAMKFILRLFGYIPVSEIDELVGSMIQENEIKRNELRKDALNQIENYDIRNDAEKIQQILSVTNKNIYITEERENVLKEFVDELKK